MKLKFSLLLFVLLFSNLYSNEVIKASENIAYKKLLEPSDVYISFEKNIPSNCKPILIDQLKKEKYRTNKYIKKDRILCIDDLDVKKNKSVIFNFGAIQIETAGKIIFENDEYIRIRKDNGKVEKIYKDGRN